MLTESIIDAGKKIESDEERSLKSRKHLLLHFQAHEIFGVSKSADKPDVLQGGL